MREVQNLPFGPTARCASLNLVGSDLACPVALPLATQTKCVASYAMSFASVRAAAKTVLAATPELDVLANNAGVMALQDKATTDGYDLQMQTNHLSHFLLAHEPRAGQAHAARAHLPRGRPRRALGRIGGRHRREMGTLNVAAAPRPSESPVLGQDPLPLP